MILKNGFKIFFLCENKSLNQIGLLFELVFQFVLQSVPTGPMILKLFLVFECVNGLSSSYFHEYFKLMSSKHTIRICQSTMGDLFLERQH